jgi:DNA replication and repair protein RecF
VGARTLTLDRISVRGFRNLHAVDVAFGPRFNVLAGDNGQGKTNLLDAIYTLATSKSFRSQKAEEVIEHGAETASVRGSFSEDGLSREQSVGQRRGLRAVRIDDKRPKTLLEYGSKTPVVVFHPGDMSLPSGGGSERRRLLDRVALHVSPIAFDDADRYLRASRERQRALEDHGPSARGLDVWESLMVSHGLALRRVRDDVSKRLADAAVRVFSKIGAEGAKLEVSYAPGAPDSEGEFQDKLAASRALDARLGTTRVGPHRDDLSLVLEGHPVRGVASQGQQRLVVLALKVAEIEVIAAAKGVRPLLLLDDISSELDRERTLSLFAFIGHEQGQVFLTTTRPELIDTSLSSEAPRRDFAVHAGQIAPYPSAPG